MPGFASILSIVCPFVKDPFRLTERAFFNIIAIFLSIEDFFKKKFPEIASA